MQYLVKFSRNVSENSGIFRIIICKDTKYQQVYKTIGLGSLSIWIEGIYKQKEAAFKATSFLNL
jgi:hypothetical protein